MNQPVYISVGIPFYNAESYLEDAICSVLAQTYQYWELILINDGSTDKSLEIAELYAKADKRIRVLSDGKNKKLPKRLNQIIDEAKFDYIARMDADDLMSNDRLEKQLQVLEKNSTIDIVTSGYMTIGKNSELTGVKIGEDYQMSAAMILEGNTNLLHASLLTRKDWYVRNLYNENSILAEDYDLWLQAAKKDDLNYVVIEEPLYWYRVVENITVFKIISGYNTQMKIIKNNYSGIITSEHKDKIIRKFKIKKAIVKSLNKLGLLNLLIHLRSNKYTKENLDYYKKNILEIEKARV